MDGLIEVPKSVSRWATLALRTLPEEAFGSGGNHTQVRASRCHTLHDIASWARESDNREVLGPILEWIETRAAVSLGESLHPMVVERLHSARAKLRLLAIDEESARGFFDSYASVLGDLVDVSVPDGLQRWQLNIADIESVIDRIVSIAEAVARGAPTSPLEEARLLLRSESVRTRQIMLLRLGWDNCTPQTLDDIGVRFGITRERVRQIASPVEARLTASKPILPLISATTRLPVSLNRPISFEEWLRKIPEPCRTSVSELHAILQMGKLGWVSLSTVEHGRRVFVVPAGIQPETAHTSLVTAFKIYRAAKQVGVISPMAGGTAANMSTADMVLLLRSMGRLDSLGKGWWGVPDRSAYLAKRTFQMLRELGSQSAEQLFLGLRRETQQWARFHCPFPPIDVFVAYLHTIECRVESGGMVRLPEDAVVPTLKASERSVVEALRASSVPLTNLELVQLAGAAGATEAMVMYSISQSPFVQTIRRGIVALRGSAAPSQLVRAAGKRRSSEPKASITGRVRRVGPGEYLVLFVIEGERIPHSIYIPAGRLPAGRWRWSDDGSTLKVRRTYIAGLKGRYRTAMAIGLTSLMLRFDRPAREVSEVKDAGVLAKWLVPLEESSTE